MADKRILGESRGRPQKSEGQNEFCHRDCPLTRDYRSSDILVAKVIETRIATSSILREKAFLGHECCIRIRV